MTLKKNLWLVLAAICLLGMIFAPKRAYSLTLEPVALSIESPLSRINSPVAPISLPARPIVIPTIGGPLTRLPSPDLGLPSLPGAVVIVAPVFAAVPAARAETPSVWASAQKTFATADASAQPSQAKLDAAFDNNAKTEKVEASDNEAPVRVPAKKKKHRDSEHLTLPEYDLLTEIGVAR